MLWTFPTRAQPPIVDVVKWILAAARMAWASDRVIQSVAAGIGQSDVAEAAGFEEAVAAPDEVDGGEPSLPPDPSFALEAPVDSEPVDSEPVDDGPSLSLDPEAPPFADVPPSAEPSSPAFDPAPDETFARRSFFAQPEPL